MLILARGFTYENWNTYRHEYVNCHQSWTNFTLIFYYMCVIRPLLSINVELVYEHLLPFDSLDSTCNAFISFFFFEKGCYVLGSNR